MDAFWLWLGNASNFISVLGFFVSIIIWLNVRRQEKVIAKILKNTPVIPDLAKHIKSGEGVQTTNPYGVSISLHPLTASIKSDVDVFQKAAGLKLTDILELNEDGLSPVNMESYIEKLRVMRRELSARKATEIHLFFQGPTAAAVIIGAIFDHWVSVKVYHYNTKKIPPTYDYWYTLTK